MKKWIAAGAYVLLLGFVFMYRYDLLEWTQQHGSLPVLLGLAFGFALIPFVPYKLVITTAAYITGAWQAAVICWAGTTLAAATVYWAARSLFRDRGRTYLERVPALHAFTAAMERRPFTTVLAARLMPVIPQAAVNVYAGVAEFPFRAFMLATGIGKLPGIIIYAYVGSLLTDRPMAGLLLFTGYTMLAGSILWISRLKAGTRR
ncbi:VTT domain-containing protein [Paenibacillus sp. P96]|uniref:TVP38/TMEM64 family membrane protein n=1 Tax=Paenibacillus zeirhizosphaerae TaxID=2987519 RepID=A0ABT9FQJ3_9BACL|nr:VTT domain-containing protein [Paenibacillus sp. P96]MDP4096791.1 VTT domain-containing protein [Paenibacillus sp. P96]